MTTINHIGQYVICFRWFTDSGRLASASTENCTHRFSGILYIAKQVEDPYEGSG